MSNQYPFWASTEALIQKQINEKRNISTSSLPAPAISDIMRGYLRKPCRHHHQCPHEQGGASWPVA